MIVGTVPAILFGDVAEKAFQMKAFDVMKSSSEVLQNHVSGLHSEIDGKMFVLKMKPATKISNELDQHYIVTCFSEAVSDTTEIGSTSVNLEKQFDAAAEDITPMAKGSKRPSTETMATPSKVNKEIDSENPKRTRSKKH